MTQEQLCNWILLATSYVAATNDRDWARRNAGILNSCYDSMLARGDPATGIMSFDSALVDAGQEIADRGAGLDGR